MKLPEYFKVKAYAPGHITGIFSIYDEYENPVQRGSRGVGFSTDMGAVATIVGRKSNEIRVTAKYGYDIAETTETGVKQLLENYDLKYKIEINIKNTLPVSQGFGMSASGTLAALLGITKVLKIKEEEALKYAHLAEVHSGTGLGDVIAEWIGGFEVRILPGIPPFGVVERIKNVPRNLKIVLAVVDRPIKTKSIIKNPEFKEKINSIGDDLIEEFLDSDQSIEEFASLSYEFAMELGLISDRMYAILKKLWQNGIYASQCMLGGSIFAFGKEAEDILVDLGIEDIYVCGLGKGPKILEIRR